MLVARQEEELKANLINVKQVGTFIKIPRYPPARYYYTVQILDQNEHNNCPYRPKYPLQHPRDFYRLWIRLESFSWVVFSICLFATDMIENEILNVLSALVIFPLCMFWIIYYGYLGIVMCINALVKCTIHIQ